MLRKIANLEVFVEDDALGLSTGCASPVDKETGEVGLNHKMVINLARNPFAPSVKPNLATDFAHELGHFLANTLGTPRAKAAFRLMMEKAKITGQRVLDVGTVSSDDYVPAEIVAMESEAWDFARLIHPGLNEAQANEALDSYKD